MRSAALAGALLLGCAARTPAIVAQQEQELAAARLRLADCATGPSLAPHPVYGDLVSLFAGTEAQVSHGDGAVTLRLPADLLFGSDPGRVRAEAAMALDLLASALAVHRDLTAEVVAHTDTAPGERPPRARTALQAALVVEVLENDHGIDGARLLAAGAGASQPRNPGSTPLEQAENRRVEVVLRTTRAP